jgi:hypothetical protein
MFVYGSTSCAKPLDIVGGLWYNEVVDDYQMWVTIRRALLLVVDAIERRYGVARTAENRRAK